MNQEIIEVEANVPPQEVPPAAEAAEATTATPPPQDEQTKAVALAVDDGYISPTTAGQLKGFLNSIAAGGGFPKRFDTMEKRIASYNLAHSLMGKRWQLCLNNIADIKGQMTIFGELPGALAEQTKEVEEKEVYCLDKDFKKICIENQNLDANPYAGVCLIKRKHRAKKEFTYTINEAIHAGQYPATKYDKGSRQQVPNPDSPWMKFTKVMLMRKAMSLAVKFEFADALVGVPVAEYDFDSAPDLVKDVTPNYDKIEQARDLNRRFAAPPASAHAN